MRKIALLVMALLLLSRISFAEGTYEKATENSMIAGTTWTWTPSITSKIKLNSVTIKKRQSSTELVTIILDSHLGASYDVVLNTTPNSLKFSGINMQGSSYVWQPDYDFILEKDDNLKVTIAGQSSGWFTVTVKGELQ